MDEAALRHQDAPARLLLIHTSDVPVAPTLSSSLTKEGFIVTSAAEDAVSVLPLGEFDGAVVAFFDDVESFVALAKSLRTETDLPIVLVSDVCSDDAVGVLEGGADKCLGTDLPAPELAARIRSLLRRGPDRHDVVIIGSLEIDRDSLKVSRGGSGIELTKTELDLLLLLAQRPGQVYTREQLVDSMWADESANEGALRAAIKRLRAKIEEDPARPEIVRTARGIGYFLET